CSSDLISVEGLGRVPTNFPTPVATSMVKRSPSLSAPYRMPAAQLRCAGATRTAPSVTDMKLKTRRRRSPPLPFAFSRFAAFIATPPFCTAACLHHRPHHQERRHDTTLGLPCQFKQTAGSGSV